MCKHKALFFDNQGHYVGFQKIDYNKSFFKFKNGCYNFLPLKSSYFKLHYWFSTTKYYIYTLGNPSPILLDNKPEIIDAKAYKSILETDLIKKLNDLSNGGFLDFLKNPKVLIILLIIGAIIWWLMSGGDTSQVVNAVTGANP